VIPVPTITVTEKPRLATRRSLRKPGDLTQAGRRGLAETRRGAAFDDGPRLLVLVVFAYLPMFGIIIAFKDYRAYQGVLGSRWVGLKNFYYLFQTDDAARIVFNTLFMNALFIVSVLVVALGIALL